MKRLVYSIVLVLLVTMVFSQRTMSMAAESEKPIVLKIAMTYPRSLPTLGECMPWFAEKIEAASGGSIKCILYDPGKLVPAFEIHDAVSTGKINAGFTATGYVSGKLPAGDLFVAVPFGMDPIGYLSWFYAGNGGALLQELYDNGGFNIKTFPALFISGPETGGWYKRRIDKPEDLKGLRIRFFGLGGRVLQKLGASVSLIPGGETFAALERGVIDGAEFSAPEMDSALGFWKTCKYNYFPGWHQPASQIELIINKDTWNSMSKRQKALVDLTVRATTQWTLARGESRQGEILINNEKKHGVQNLYWSDEMLSQIKDAWLEVVSEECAKDAMFKKVWEDLKAFQDSHNHWESLGYMPRPPRSKQ